MASPRQQKSSLDRVTPLSAQPSIADLTPEELADYRDAVSDDEIPTAVVNCTDFDPAYND